MSHFGHSLRNWLTAARPAKQLLFVLAGVSVWLWLALGHPPVVQLLLGTLLIVGFVLVRYGVLIWYEAATQPKDPQQRRRKDRREFLLLLGGLTLLIGATMIPTDPQRGIPLCLTLILVGILYGVVMR
jgi:hypothetical protein